MWHEKLAWDRGSLPTWSCSLGTNVDYSLRVRHLAGDLAGTPQVDTGMLRRA